MRPFRSTPTALLAPALLATFLVACGGGASAPGWTYAPAPSETPVASGAASGEPSGAPSASPAASAGAQPSASAATSGGPGAGGDALEVTAVNIAFEEKELTAPADQPFSIHFVNDDPAGMIHDIDIRDSGGQTLQDQDTIDGGTEATYEYTPLAAGDYTFICSIHPIPAMTGTLTVE
jgi:plastocyanin